MMNWKEITLPVPEAVLSTGQAQPLSPRGLAAMGANDSGLLSRLAHRLVCYLPTTSWGT